jgi:hypothetical protein
MADDDETMEGEFVEEPFELFVLTDCDVPI